MTPTDWSTKKYFVRREFFCLHCLALRPAIQNEGMDEAFVSALDDLREAVGFPLFVTSGYRCSQHPVERVKRTPGVHTYGVAADLAVYGQHGLKVVGTAYEQKFRGFGVYPGHVHLDMYPGDWERPRPLLWSGE